MKTYTIDPSGRICLGKEFAGKTYALALDEKGVIQLSPVKVVPENEAWLYENEAAHKSVMRGLSQAKKRQAKPLSIDLDSDELCADDEINEKRASR